MSSFVARFRGRDDQGKAEAFQHALERLERLRSRGLDEAEARREASAYLDAESLELFRLALGLEDSAAQAPAPGFAESLEAALRGSAAAEPVPIRPIPGRRHVRALGAVAACVVLLAGVAAGASRSLPGDALYSVKRSSESVRLGMASGTAEGLLRVELADRRLEEVRRLVGRAGLAAIGVPGRPSAAAPGRIRDPRIAELVERTLAEAERHIRVAARILLPARNAAGLDRLAIVARKGHTTAVRVAGQLPFPVKPPVLNAAVVLERIEGQAIAARQDIAPPPTATPNPCATPSPTPSPSPPAPSQTPSPTASPSPTPSPSGPTPSPSPTPTASPTPTPCTSPPPTPTPTPTPKAKPSQSAQPSSPTPKPQEPAPSQAPEPSPEPDGNPDASGDDEGGTVTSQSDCGWFRRWLSAC